MKKQKIKYKLKFFLRHNRSLVNVAFGVAVTLSILTVIIVNFKKQASLKQPEKKVFQTDENLELDIPNLSTENWKTYQNNWYGFEVKYPANWSKPSSKNSESGSKWEYRYQFRKKELGNEDLLLGFDIVLYDVGKLKDLSNTDEFPSLKQELNENETCRFITGQMVGKEDFSAEEVFIPSSDDCHNQAFFYSLIRNEYIFNMAPIYKENWAKGKNLKNDAISNMPEFFSAASSFNLVDIKREKPSAVKPVSRSPLPIAAQEDNGKLVCAKKNDHPGKSKKNKGRHLDMECCLDPDEYPNPHCYYSKSKYGKYLD